MAKITTVNAVAGIGTGTTWDTAVAATDRIRCNSITLNDSQAENPGRNHDTGNLLRELCLGARTVDVSITCDLTFGGEWLKLYGLLAGTSTASPAEVNTGEGDYLHNLDITSTHSKFFTLAYMVEDDVIIEVKSVKLTSMTITGEVNGLGTVTFSGIGSSAIITGWTNSVAGLQALTSLNNDLPACINGANMYFRLANYSTSTALGSANNQEIISFNYTLNRPITAQYVTRGADTVNSVEPYLSGISRGSLELTFGSIDDSKATPFADYIAKTKKMFELYIDGQQIGSGANYSLKLQCPYMLTTSTSGYGIDGQAVRQQPSATYQLLAPGTAAAGMSGVTFYNRLVSVDQRSTSWIA